MTHIINLHPEAEQLELVNARRILHSYDALINENNALAARNAELEERLAKYRNLNGPGSEAALDAVVVGVAGDVIKTTIYERNDG